MPSSSSSSSSSPLLLILLPILLLHNLPREASSSFLHASAPLSRRRHFHGANANANANAASPSSSSSFARRRHHRRRLSPQSRLGDDDDDDDDDDRVVVGGGGGLPPPPPPPPAGSVAEEEAPATTTADAAASVATRRAVLRRTLLLAAAATATTTTTASARSASASVGTLPEFADAGAILQSLTIDVSGSSSDGAKQQYEDTILFFERAFDMKVLRERKSGGGGGGDDGGGREAWLGFGPEDLDVPPGFVLPVSSFGEYGGHASLHVRCDPSSSSGNGPLYARSPGEYNDAPAPGDNVAYLQLGVPTYRISQMVKYGGNVIDAYGWVNAICPAGLPIRAVVGVRSPDPMMLVALYCDDVGASKEFYAGLGFGEGRYPYARPNDGAGQFEPRQPRGSAYLAPAANSMGVLLLPREKKRFFGGKLGPIVPNPVLASLNVVYAGAAGADDPGVDDADGGASSATLSAIDPSGVTISFASQDAFARELKATTAVVPPP